MKKKVFKIVVITVAVVLILFAIRMVLCPPMLQMESTSFTEDEKVMMSDMVNANVISIQSMANEVKDKKVILAGEIHFQEKVMQKFTEFLALIPVDSFVLALELPSDIQPDIDNYMSTGNGRYLEAIKNCSHCLPYTNIIKWSHDNKPKVKGVYAIDENRSEIILKRAFCTDSRNITMTNRILEIQHGTPGIPVIFYGGQLHCLQSGRYLYDTKSREPIGSRLLKSFSKNEISTIIFSANRRFVSYEAWDQNTVAFPVNDRTKNLERRYFVHEPVKGDKNCGPFFNYFVNVGDLE